MPLGVEALGVGTKPFEQAPFIIGSGPVAQVRFGDAL